MKKLKKLKWNLIFLALGLMALGVILIIFPNQTFKTICYALSVVLFVIGVVSFASYLKKDINGLLNRYDLVVGLSTILAGILVILKVEEIQKLIPVILGFLITISGIIKFQNSMDMLRLKYKKWMISFVLAMINIVAGIILLINPFSDQILIVLTGIFLVFSGAADLYVSISASLFVNDAEAKGDNIALSTEVEPSKNDESTED